MKFAKDFLAWWRAGGWRWSAGSVVIICGAALGVLLLDAEQSAKQRMMKSLDSLDTGLASLAVEVEELGREVDRLYLRRTISEPTAKKTGRIPAKLPVPKSRKLPGPRPDTLVEQQADEHTRRELRQMPRNSDTPEARK